jgi:WD40 repeat protein
MEPRRTPRAATVVATAVAVLALAAIPVMLLHRGTTATPVHVADSPTVTTDGVPIRMVLVHGTDGATAADGSILLQGQTGQVLSLVFSADETMMAGTDRAGTAHVWSRSGRLLATVTPASGLHISSVAFTVKDRQFVTVSSDGSVHFWPLPAAN